MLAAHIGAEAAARSEIGPGKLIEAFICWVAFIFALSPIMGAG
jgi:hypothetical protein